MQMTKKLLVVYGDGSIRYSDSNPQGKILCCKNYLHYNFGYSRCSTSFSFN